MSATAALFNTPSFRFSPSLTSRHKSQRPISLLGLPTSKPFFIGGFASSRPGFERFRRPMTEVSRSDAFRCSDDDVESNGFMEEEAILTNGSSEFRRDFCSGGLESALNRSSKWLVAALFAAFLVWKHDAEAMWIAMGSVVNSWSSTSLKQILNQQRPVSALRSDPGMPSSHAQSIFYTAVFAVLSQFKWLGVNAFSVTVGAFALACGSYLSWLRVSEKLHTINQVLVGAALGTTCSIMWFWSWHAFVLKACTSFLWVRVIVILGSTVFCVVFVIYIIRRWPREDD